MATTTRGLRYPVSGDIPNVHTDIQNLATDVDGMFIVSATVGALPAASKVGRLAYITATGQTYVDNGTSWAAILGSGVARRAARGFSVPGVVSVGLLTGWFHSQETGETRTLVKARFSVETGTATAQLLRNGSVIATYSITVTPTTDNTGLPVTLVENDEMDLNITAASGATGLMCTISEKMA